MLLIAIVAEGTTHPPDRQSQRVVADLCVAPDIRNQLGRADGARAVLDWIGEDVEAPWLKRDFSTSRRQLALRRVRAELAKALAGMAVGRGQSPIAHASWGAVKRACGGRPNRVSSAGRRWLLSGAARLGTRTIALAASP